MFRTLSCTITLFILSSLIHTILAQQFPYSIQHISLLSSANLTSFDAIRNLGLTWDIVQANGVNLQFTFSTADSSVELMAGPVAGASDKVLDVLGLHYTYTSAIFSFRTSLPSGDYHLRVNATVNTTVGSNTTTQSLTARGGGFHWTLPSNVGCGSGLTPEPFTPITSPVSPLFTSLVVVQPTAGQNFPQSFAGIFVSWGWRNRKNAGGTAISRFSIQVVKNTDGTAVGAPIVIDPNNLWLGSTSLNASAIGMGLNQAYRLRIQYINAVPDGQIIPGQVVTYTSEEFNIVAPNVNCSARKSPPACPTGVNNATVNMMLQFENFEPVPKGDSSPGHFPTVGYGHKCIKANCTEVSFPFPLNKTTALQLLASDLKVAVSCVNQGVNSFVTLNDNQVGALGSFSFNIGCQAFKNSTLLQRMNAGESPNTVAAQELPRWNVSGGLVLPGLVKRRAAEVTLFQTSSSILQHPCV